MRQTRQLKHIAPGSYRLSLAHAASPRPLARTNETISRLWLHKRTHPPQPTTLRLLLLPQPRLLRLLLRVTYCELTPLMLDADPWLGQGVVSCGSWYITTPLNALENIRSRHSETSCHQASRSGHVPIRGPTHA